MTLNQIWTDHYLVTSYQSDRFGKLHIHSLAHFLQESAWRHTDSRSVGYNDLLKHNRLWVLTGMRIVIHEFPDWGQEIIINTWSSGISGLFAFRDFEILDLAGKIIAKASTSWIIIDSETHRPCRMDEKLRQIHTMNSVSDIGRPARLPEFPSGSNMPSFKVQYSDIDVHNHVNNTRYIEWCENQLPVDVWEKYFIHELEINFLNESLLGNEIIFTIWNPSEFIYRLSAKNLNTSKEVCRVEFRLRKKDSEME